MHLRGYKETAEEGTNKFLQTNTHIIYFFIPLTSNGNFYPIYGRAPAPPQGYCKCVRAHFAPGYPVGRPSPQIGRHRESIPEPPDQRTEALPTELASNSSQLCCL